MTSLLPRPRAPRNVSLRLASEKNRPLWSTASVTPSVYRTSCLWGWRPISGVYVVYALLAGLAARRLHSSSSSHPRSSNAIKMRSRWLHHTHGPIFTELCQTGTPSRQMTESR